MGWFHRKEKEKGAAQPVAPQVVASGVGAAAQAQELVATAVAQGRLDQENGGAELAVMIAAAGCDYEGCTDELTSLLADGGNPLERESILSSYRLARSRALANALARPNS